MKSVKMVSALNSQNGDFMLTQQVGKRINDRGNEWIFRWWISRGFALIPCQPGAKWIMSGWGEHQDSIDNMDRARRELRADLNIAVLVRDNRIALDFDQPGLYEYWTNRHPALARTYTERTPRGGAHVFFYGQAPEGLHLVDGVEIKRVLLIAPSVVDGKPYTRNRQDEIIPGNPVEIFSHLVKPGCRSAYVLDIEQRQRERERERERNSSPSPVKEDLISQIKARWSIERVISIYRPGAKLIPRGKVIVGHCFFHDDKNPSFYILPEIGRWGCHACGIRGDVIDLYARFEKIDNREAIHRMGRA
jgi:hypothetical protein